MSKLNRGDKRSDRNQHIWVAGSVVLTEWFALMRYVKSSMSLALSNAALLNTKYMNRKRLINRPLLVLAIGLSLSGLSSSGFAMGVGSAIADSYIGQTLVVRVPLFNIENPDSLAVKLTQAESSTARLQAQIDRANSQIAVLVRSDGRVNEPYLNFTLELSDGNNVFSKEFTVLLNLSPQGTVSSDLSASNPANISAQPLANTGSNGVGSLMGPYEWAEAGRIPERFGAVLDGQSLWRVARRINRGLGVSINQMMWSLYQQNPDAFSSTSINSLKAGSFLKIPTYQAASQLSDSEAKNRIDNTIGNSLVSSSEVQASNQQAPEKPARGVDVESDEVAQQFQLTAIDETVSAGGSVAGANDGKSQEIISSLAETVGNLTQELIRKDKQIAFLEEKVTALAEFAGVDADLVGETVAVPEVSDQAEETEFESTSILEDLGTAELDEDILETESLALEDEDGLLEDESLEEVLSESEIFESETLDAEVVGLDSSEETDDIVVDEVEVVESKEVNQSFFHNIAPWQWLALLGVGILLLAGLFKRRLSELFVSLNLFNKDSGVEFKQSVFDSTDAPIGREIPEAEASTERDYSVMSSVKRELDEDEAIEGVSYLSVDEGGEYVEADTKDFTQSDLEFVNDEDMSFSDRFERLIKDKDFDFARELLDFARYNEIDDERYHCERLRLLQAMQDEDGFYEYYYEIESKIPSFATNHQTQISQLVVALSQNEG